MNWTRLILKGFALMIVGLSAWGFSALQVHSYELNYEVQSLTLETPQGQMYRSWKFVETVGVVSGGTGAMMMAVSMLLSKQFHLV